MSREDDRFPLHTACREGKGKSQFTGFLRQLLTSSSIRRGRITKGMVATENTQRHYQTGELNIVAQNNPELSKKKDDDGRYPIHWATSANCYDLVVMLVTQPSFDPDVQVS
jgi:hypothetical protein